MRIVTDAFYPLSDYFTSLELSRASVSFATSALVSVPPFSSYDPPLLSQSSGGGNR